MRSTNFFPILLFAIFSIICHSAHAQTVKTIILDDQDFYSGTYLVVEPSGEIEGALVIFAGFGQRAEDTFTETDLDEVAYQNNILIISFAAGNKLYADSITRTRITRMLKDVLVKYNVEPSKFVIGGFSAGGMIALRYVELANQFPELIPVQPKAVFVVDSPIDIFTIWNNLEESYHNNYSQPAYEEAERAMRFIREDYGVPHDNIGVYSQLTAFSMNKEYSQNEIFLKNTAVRAYHDVDIPWRLINRNQTVHNSNYEVTAELINRLLLMGNHKAEFIQTYQTGYRANGERHPHSWSIVDEAECISWVKEQIR